MPWAVVGGAIAAGGAIIGSDNSASAATTAANQQAASQQAALDFQKQTLAQTTANLSPYLQSGNNALSVLNTQLGITPGTAGTAAVAPAAPSWSTSTTPATQADVVTAYQQLLGRQPDQGGLTAYVGKPLNQIYTAITTNNGQSGGEYAQDLAAGKVPGETPGTAGTAASINPNAPLTKPFTAADLTQTPGYNFEMQQGQQAVQNSGAAQGGAFSGNTLKALQTFGTGLAQQDYWNQYNAYTQQQNTQFNQLSSLAGAGQNAAAQQGGFAGGAANQIGNNLTNIGNVQAAGTVANANSQNNLINSLLAQFGGGSGIGNGLSSIYGALTNPTTSAGTSLFSSGTSFP